jgi:hypothetical protein
VTRPAGWYPDPEGSGAKGKVIGGVIAAVVVLVVVGAAAVVADPGFPGPQKAAQGEYVLVKMTVTNVSTEPQTFFASFNKLSDGTTEFRSDDEAWIYLGNTLADLSPGDTIDTAVVFDVPVGTDPESIELHDGPFSEGVTAGL